MLGRWQRSRDVQANAAKELGLDLPIINEVYQLLYDGKNPHDAVRDLGMEPSAARAKAKLVESFPDGVRETVQCAMRRFRFATGSSENSDPRLAALARAVRDGKVVHVDAKSRRPRRVHPIALVLTDRGWAVADALAEGALIPLEDCRDINISRLGFNQGR